MYEVVSEVPESQLQYIAQHEDIEEFRTPVYSIAKDQRKLLCDVLALATVQRMIRRHDRLAKAKKLEAKRGRKPQGAEFVMSEKNIRKMTYGRLASLYKKFAPPEIPKLTDLTTNRLTEVRVAYGFSRGQVAEAMKTSYASVYYTESAKSLPQETIDSYIGAVIRLSKGGPFKSSGLSVPTDPKARAAKPEGDEFGYEVTD